MTLPAGAYLPVPRGRRRLRLADCQGAVRERKTILTTTSGVGRGTFIEDAADHDVAENFIRDFSSAGQNNNNQRDFGVFTTSGGDFHLRIVAGAEACSYVSGGRRRGARADQVAGLRRARQARWEPQRRHALPPRDGLSSRSLPAERLDPVGEPSEPGAAARDGAADAVISDRNHDALALLSHLDRDARRGGMLGRVCECFRAHEQERCLDRLRKPADLSPDLDRDRRARRQQLESRHQPSGGACRWVYALRELAQLASGLIQFVLERSIAFSSSV